METQPPNEDLNLAEAPQPNTGFLKSKMNFPGFRHSPATPRRSMAHDDEDQAEASETKGGWLSNIHLPGSRHSPAIPRGDGEDPAEASETKTGFLSSIKLPKLPNLPHSPCGFCSIPNNRDILAQPKADDNAMDCRSSQLACRRSMANYVQLLRQDSLQLE